MKIQDIDWVDILMFVGGPILLWLMAFLFRRINRWMGVLLVLVYLIYLVYLIRGAVA
jgi:Ca2+/Na+ antiporter